MTHSKRALTTRAVVVWLSAALVLAIMPGADATESTDQVRDLLHVRDHILVRLAPGANAEAVLGEGSEVVFGRWRVHPVPAGRTAKEMVDELTARPGVEVAELDYVVRLDPVSDPVLLDHEGSVAVDDPFHDLQWHFPAVQLAAAWADGTGTGVVVAVVDTGISQGGEDLDCHTFVSPYNAITGTPGPAAAEDDNGHGTHVAGTVAQCTDNGVGVAGVAFDASLMPVKVLDASGSGEMSWIADGIAWAHSNGADVINLSLGCSGCSSSAMDDAIEAAVADGVVVVAASGNDGVNSVFYPASHPDVIAVGATEFNNQRAFYSNGGSALDVVAPGGDLGADANDDGFGDGVLQETFVEIEGTDEWAYWFFQGTSMASPHVAGAAAVLLSVDPGLTNQQVRDILRTTALDVGSLGFDISHGHGLIQIHDAICSLTADAISPTWPSGADLAVSNVTGTSVRLTWPEADDNLCLASYQIYQDGVHVATTGSSATQTTIGNLTPATTYEFDVRPVDVAGNEGADLHTSVETLDSIAPVWGGDAVLEVDKYGETQLTVRWEGASDNVGVTGYRLRMDGNLVAEITGLKTTVTGLSPGTPYQFEVLARDAAGNWSDPFKATLRTARHFIDTQGTTFYNDILWMSGEDITRGCNPPTNDLFCPDESVTRGQFAAFTVRALGLTQDDHPGFVDVPANSTFANDIGKLATAGITRGCNPPTNDMFCPDDPVTRAQMAAFIVRMLGLTANDHPGFIDVPADSTFAGDIGKLATAGITRGCNPPVNDMFCPDDPVTRGQLAAFLKRALD